MHKVETKTVLPATRLRGDFIVPGDKSISHRAIMFASLAQGESRIRGLLRGEDCLSTLHAFRCLGVEVNDKGDDEIIIQGRGLDGLKEPDDVIDCGNSGTTMRLMSGILAAQPFFTILTGDQYLRRRPMGRVITPLTSMGAKILGRDDHSKAPLAIDGGGLVAAEYHSPIASAQVKSAVLLAGMQVDGVTTVYEPHLSRDHSERMLRYFGADLESFSGGTRVKGRVVLSGKEVDVAGDISSAAFFLVAGLIVPDSELLLKNVGVNPTRSGIIDILQQMGGAIELTNLRELSGEPVADLLVKSSHLHGIEIGGDLIPRAIDEFPVVSVAAAFADGVTIIRDAKELRVKETDRIAAMCDCLGSLGVAIEPLDDGMRIVGGRRLTGGEVNSCGDHRIAMSMAIAALGATTAIKIVDTACTETSFPGFWELLTRITEN
ncbi:3-phosphoshikimate 1-carboxyvinyltransferase [Desulfuromusa kysingii]|uniref:3-phosphoshikimate 1-carboxyvinyltransferase n=1 Tax=Desulfuromusa kysingii TaxID=37625 RepID=A0A1H3YCQ8_9BACT|nr:3-phosphoshikimate 1-carboxyvinyltransferase [Desulfuromusa kysingii]SEA09395.1 3-phosphoshikimate 1-carboxyvinyltransferase [Desulfuromusa kysingii]